MQRVKFIYLLSLLFLFVACENDNGEDNQSANLEGAWELKTLDYNGSTTSGSTTTNFDGTARNVDFEIDFNADGSYTSRGGYTVTLVYDFGGIRSSQMTEINDFFGSGTYTLNGDRLSITRNSDGETNTATISTVSQNELAFELEQQEIIMGQSSTSSFTLNGDFVLDKK
ncbi:MAG: hypothetical protein Sapg2KO_08130 [Saprospiraceae bacterium]